MNMKRLIEYILENAYKRKEYWEDVNNAAPQIIENLVMIVWCKIYDPENLNYNHWKTELLSHVGPLTDTELKNNSKIGTVLKEVFYTKRYCDRIKGIRKLGSKKLIKEGIVDNKIIGNVCNNTIPYLRELIGYIAANNWDDVYNYIFNL